MTQVMCDMSMSLDGFIAGPNDNPDNGLGDGGDALHQWLYGLTSWRESHGIDGGESNPDSEILGEAIARTGAVIMGRRMFDIAEDGWGDNPPFHCPVFIVTHRAREALTKDGGTTYNFVTDGIESALKQAEEAAADKDVSIAGGADIIQQYLKAGLLDEIQIHVAPVLLGQGRPLFDTKSTERIQLDPIRVVDSPTVTHVRYRVKGSQ